MNENKLMPQIRFKEFTDNWAKSTLGEVTDIYDGTHQTPLYTDSGVMFLSVENIKTLSSEKYISQEAFDKEFKIFPQKDDVLMTRIGDIGTANVVSTNKNKAYYVSLALLKNKGMNAYFLKENIHSPYVKKELWHRTLHIAFPKKINKNEIANVLVKYPLKNEEQVKIGNFFKNIDSLINLNQKKYEKLINIKKSFLEKMFPNNSEQTPQIRFNGFLDFWKCSLIKEVCSISTGKSNTQDKIDDGKYPFYVRSPIIEKSNRYLYDEEAVLTVGDGVGTGKVYHYVNGKYDLHQRVYRMFNFDEETSSKYFYHYFSNYFNKRVMSMTAKTSVDSVRYAMISDMDISKPSKTEQDKISVFLTEIDNIIVFHQKKIDKLQNIKQSLLAKMFV